MTDSSGTIQARYDYDPYGHVTTITGTVPSDFQYAGYYTHATSGLNLTLAFAKVFTNQQDRRSLRCLLDDSYGVVFRTILTDNKPDGIALFGSYDLIKVCKSKPNGVSLVMRG